MASNKINRLARLEGRAIAICDQVFSAWIEELSEEELLAVIERCNEAQGPLRPYLESWLIGMHPAPDVRPDLWQQAIRKVIDPNGICHTKEDEQIGDSQIGEDDR